MIATTPDRTTTRTITFDLPPEIPAPKFKLFDRVQYGDRVGAIVGLEYTTFENALLLDLTECGWSYFVSYTYQATQANILKTQEPEDQVWEHELRVCR